MTDTNSRTAPRIPNGGWYCVINGLQVLTVDKFRRSLECGRDQLLNGRLFGCRKTGGNFASWTGCRYILKSKSMFVGHTHHGKTGAVAFVFK
jgi:hypothetical protein